MEEDCYSPRDKVYAVVVQNPGLHFREIQRRTNLATGAIQYHISYLERKNYIKSKKEGKFLRFYANGENVDTNLMNLLRQKQLRTIVLFLLNKRRATAKVISQSTDFPLNITKNYLSKLIESKIVSKTTEKSLTFYSINEKEKIISLFIIHKKSFLDSLVDSFVDIWENELSLVEDD
ncbi:MAG: winged helix-turn-helix transcriptional regulator [Candidatus ainarchaeum sp.]|nr:winged helix-turn-helix transcriptional regulator [Candidatus ainarchaeum sp.]